MYSREDVSQEDKISFQIIKKYGFDKKSIINTHRQKYCQLFSK